MKNKIFVIFIVLFGISFAYANTPVPNYAKYYKISDNLNITFKQLNDQEQKQLSKEDKKLYKKLAKNEKYTAKGKLEKADSYLPNHIPNMLRLMEFYNSKEEYTRLIKTAKKKKDEK